MSAIDAQVRANTAAAIRAAFDELRGRHLSVQESEFIAQRLADLSLLREQYLTLRLRELIPPPGGGSMMKAETKVRSFDRIRLELYGMSA